MKKRMGKLVSMILCLSLLLSLLPAAVLAAESGTLETGLTWTLEDGVLTISGQGAMPDFANADAIPWYPSSSSITSVVVNEGVTRVGKMAFAYTAAASVTLPENGLTSIGADAFYQTKLTAIDIPDTVTEIGTGAFYGCTQLADVTLPSRLTVLSKGLFYGCQALKTIELPETLSSIDKIAFCNCVSLQSIAIPAGVTSIASGSPGSFKGCTGLESMTVAEGNSAYHVDGNCLIETESKTLIQGFNNSVTPGASTVTSIADYAFYGMYGLDHFTIPNGVESIGENAFAYCYRVASGDVEETGLTSITIPGSVKTIGSCAFNADKLLSSVTMEDGLESIGSYAFAVCPKLTDVVIPTTVKTIDVWAFASTALETITILSGDVAFTTTTGQSIEDTLPASAVIYGYEGSTAQTYAETYGRTFYVLAETSGTLSTGLTWNLDEQGMLTISGQGAMPDWTTVDDVPWYPLRNQIMAVLIGSGVTTVGGLAFAYCPNLEAVTFERGTALERIGSMAFAQSGLNTISVPDTVTEIGAGAFYGCGELTYVYLPDSLEVLQSLLFCDCYRLADINFPSALTTIQNGVFTNCRTLTNIVIPAGVTSIDFSEARAENPFYGCTGLESITVADGNTSYRAVDNCLIEIATKTLVQGCNSSVIPTDGSVTSIGYAAFYGMSGLEIVSIPDTVTAIGSYAFASCCRDTDDDGLVDQGLRQVTIPGSVKTIGEAAFNSSRLLNSVSIMEDGLETIGGWAFVACTELTYMMIPETVTSIGSRAFYESGLTEIWIYTREAEFESGDNYSPDEILPEDVAIYGYLNSTAHDYAKTYGRTFYPLDSQDQPAGCNHGNWEITETATCTEAGKQIKTCVDCGAIVVEDMEALGHMVSNTIVYTKEPTCTEDGAGYNLCERCGEAATEIFTISARHTPDYSAYGYDENEHWYVCTVCGEHVDVFQHNYFDTYQHDADHHWNACTVCGAHCNEAAHTWSGWQTGVTAAGIQTRTCEICERSETVVVSTAPDEDNNYVVTPGGDGETTVTEITVDRSVLDGIVSKNAEAIANGQSPAGLTMQLGEKTSVTYDAKTLEAIQKAVEAKQQSSSAARADLLLRVKGYGDTESLVEEEELTEAQEETVGEYVSNNCWTVVVTADYYDYSTSGNTWVLVDTAEVDFDGGDEDAVEVTVECDLEKFDYRSERFGVARVEEDGSLTPVESETNEEDGTITWHTRHFSLYMAYEKGAGVKVTGQVKGYHSGNAPVVALYAAGDTERETPIATAALGEAAASGSQYLWNFAFDAVASGTYDLVVTKDGHLTYTVKGVTVGAEDLDLTASSNAAVKLISLLAGDVNGDGSINEGDVSTIRLSGNINKTTSAAANKTADVNGDGSVNEGDVSTVRLAQHINKSATNNCSFDYAVEMGE